MGAESAEVSYHRVSPFCLMSCSRDGRPAGGGICHPLRVFPFCGLPVRLLLILGHVDGFRHFGHILDRIGFPCALRLRGALERVKRLLRLHRRARVGDRHALDVPAEGEYEVSFISPVDKDGSIYEVPKTAKVKSEAEDKDGKDTGDELPFEFKPIAADKTDADALNAIVKSVGDAVKKGDETLTGGDGSKVIELVKENAKANPNADKEKVEEESQKAEDADKGTGESKPSNDGDGGNGNNNAGGESGANGQNQGGDGGGSSNSGNSGNDGGSQHVHNWVTQTIHHNAQYQTIHHEAVYDYRSICNGCGADITGNVDAHMQDALLNGNTACGAYHTENVLVSQAWDETVEISPAWDETFTICSGCNERK